MFRIILIIIGTLVLAFVAGANSAITLSSKFSPARGLAMDPTSAQALIGVNELALAKKNKASFRKIARDNSLRALRSEPLSSRALRQLGTYYFMTGNVAHGRSLIQLSATLSRRDPTGQIWLADDYLRQGKERQALEAIDVIIRTEPQTREAAYQVLGSALGNAEFRKFFVSYVRDRPFWLRPFIQFNVSMEEPQLLSRTLIHLQPLPSEFLDDATAGALLIALVNKAPIGEARTFYLSLPGSRKEPLTSLTFARQSESFRFPPIGWELWNTADVQGFGGVEDDVVNIEALAIPGRSGTAARKLLFLDRGRYRWFGTADLGRLGGGSSSVNIFCNAGPGKWLKSSSVELKSGRNSFQFSIAADCPAQLLTLDIVGADGQTDSSMSVSEMRLSPFSNSNVTNTVAKGDGREAKSKTAKLAN